MLSKKIDLLSSPSLHLRDTLPKTVSYIDLEPRRFAIFVEEFNGRVKEISCNLERIKDFSSFSISCHVKLIECGSKQGDVRIFSKFFEKSQLFY